ncbi:hypothetical protein VIGAN_02008900, partial [Vigna angularis var. angularis]
ELWHKRLGHCHLERMLKIKKNDMSTGPQRTPSLQGRERAVEVLKCNGGEKLVEGPATPTNPSPPNSLLMENTSTPHHQALIRPKTFISRTPSSSDGLNFTISASHGPCLIQCLRETPFPRPPSLTG